MRNSIIISILTVVLLATTCFLISCSSHNENVKEDKASETILFFFPYSGLEGYIQSNINAVKRSMKERGGLDGIRVIVFQAQTPYIGRIFELKYAKNEKNEKIVEEEIIQSDINISFSGKDHNATLKAIEDVVSSMANNAVAQKYSMVIGCHGSAWLPSGIAQLEDMNVMKAFGTATTSFQIDNAVFAQAVKNCGVKFQYILFDACYMANIETVYDFKDICTYFIASPTEIMGAGLPYDRVFTAMLQHDYKTIADNYCTYYITETNEPYATLSVTDCRELEEMAHIIQKITNGNISTSAELSKIQNYDGMTAPMFYDLEDYVTSFCTDNSLIEEFKNCLTKLVPYHNNTASFYTTFHSPHIMDIHSFSGISISQPTENPNAADMLHDTIWWKATH